MAGPGGWDREVASVAFQWAQGIVLIDPLVSNWRPLDALVAGQDVAVVLTAAWHERSSVEVAARYDAAVFVHNAGLSHVRCSSAQAMAEGELVAGLEVITVAGVDEGEVVLWLPAHRALVTAEVLTGTSAGLRIAESPALRSRSAQRAWLAGLADLPVDLVLPAHGPPILQDGQEELAAALRRPPW